MEMLNRAIEDADAFSKMMEKAAGKMQELPEHADAPAPAYGPANREQRRARAHSLRKPGDLNRK